MPQPPAVNALADPLIEAYRAAWARIVAEQERILDDPRQWRRSRRLAEMSRTIAGITDDLDASARDWVSKQFPRAYGAGLVDGAAAVGASPLWSSVHQEAVEHLAYGVYDDLLSATKHVNDTTKDLIRFLARQEGTFSVVGGETATAAGRNLARELARHSISAVVYKDGSRRGLADYADMNLRTTTALGYNNGTLNAAPTTEFWEVFDGPDCGWTSHDDIDQALGKIVHRDEALAFPISHPRCRRAFGPRPDIDRPASARAGLGSVTPSQVAAQRAQDAARASRQASRRRAGGRAPRTPRGSRSARGGQRSTWVPEEATGAPRGMGAALPVDQDRAWASYVGQSYEVNSALRRGEIPEIVPTLDQVFKTSRVKESTTTYRMIDDEKIYRRIERRKPNGTVGLKDDAYLSTSLDRNIVADFSREEFPVRLDIDVAPGTSAFYVGDRYASRAIMMDQKEMVFPRGTQIRIYDHRRLPDGTIVAKAYLDG